MKWSRERFRMAARNRICPSCPRYGVNCDTKKMCPRVENMIDKWMEEQENEVEN